MLSARYAWAAAALLLLAAVPTVRNVYRRPEPPPRGALEAELGDRLGPFEPGPRRAGTVEEHFGARDFATRAYGGVELFAARSYDGKKLFHFPELALTYGRTATAAQEAKAGAFPARVLWFEGRGDTRVAAYALLYGRRPVARPIAFYLSILPELFVGRREPMTLLYVQADAPRGAEEAVEERVLRLLADALGILAGA